MSEAIEMLTPEGCAARRERLWAALSPACDALLIADPQHLVYFANYFASPFEFRSADSSALLVLTRDESVLVADNLVQPFLDAAHVDRVVGPTWYNGKTSAPHRRGLLVRSALDALAPIPGRRIGVEFGSVPAGVVEGLRSARTNVEFLDLDPIIRPLRRSKDADEIAILRRSMRAGEAAHAAAIAEVEPGTTEHMAYRIVQEAAGEAAGMPVLVYGDFVSGPRCEQIGGPPSDRVIGRGDLFLLDCSVVVHGYRGDFANTWAVGGQPSPEQSELASICLDALAAGESILKAGVAARDVDAAVRGRLSSSPGHSGHGLGLGHPEPPYFVPGSDEILLAGDVVAIEPGKYVEGIGGMRFERNYLVTTDGFEALSRHALGLN